MQFNSDTLLNINSILAEDYPAEEKEKKQAGRPKKVP